MMLARTIETIQRREGGRILAGLIRFCGDFDRAEEALQDSYTRALAAWPRTGLPENPAAWLTTVAKRAAIDTARQHARTDWLDPSELENFHADEAADPAVQVSEKHAPIEDDLLRLIFTCCHPALSPTAQTALALRTISQLTVAEIARAYVEPEATTAQRLVRAKRKIADAKIPYVIPEAADLPSRLDAVLAVIYLVFNEGYTAAQSASLIRVDLCEEAIRLARLVNALLPQHAEALGLQALMELHHARRFARVGTRVSTKDDDLIPLESQDRTRWDRAAIDAATTLLDQAVLLRTAGPFQIEAAIASLHCRAATAADTDWPQIALLYDALYRHRATDIVALNSAVAHAMAYSIDEGLRLIDAIAVRGNLAQYHLLHAARADLLRRQGKDEDAITAYEAAIEQCHNDAERRYLQKRVLDLQTLRSQS
jgi:RNA polymerase sigma-70 factor, ECF subfamily